MARETLLARARESKPPGPVPSENDIKIFAEHFSLAETSPECLNRAGAAMAARRWEAATVASITVAAVQWLLERGPSGLSIPAVVVTHRTQLIFCAAQPGWPAPDLVPLLHRHAMGEIRYSLSRQRRLG